MMKNSFLYFGALLFLAGFCSFRSSGNPGMAMAELQGSDSLKQVLNSCQMEMERREKEEIELLKSALVRMTSDELDDYYLSVEIMQKTNVRMYYLDKNNKVLLTRNLSREQEKDTAFVNSQVRRLRKEGNGFSYSDKTLNEDYTIYFDDSAFLEELKKNNR